MPAQIRALVIGFIGGIFGGLVGLGGGVVMVPLLTLWAGLSQHEAHGTSLAAVIATGIVGAWVYAGRGAVNWSAAAWLAAAAVSASYVSARYASRVPGMRLRKYFGAFLLVVAVLLVLKNRLFWNGGLSGAALPLVLLAIGALAGGIAGLLGVGGGVLIVPLLVLGTGLSQHTAQGTSLAALVLTGVTGTWVYARHGHLRRHILVMLLPGVILGCWLGGHGALGASGWALRLLFAAVLLWLGLRYLGLGAWLRLRVRRPALTSG
ncbi:MAG: sulfite exporter TauE/SafE family protein [Armatimonadota bacterium]|nr:sulfite exporter TauE/SafE family protein [Armatimonadota bacterium]MDR7450988.1 sulfite exporter TauE/SafE family protein [Armatimonadota bacterium]MDR7465991.1 sulfite exporter TauE/SafE family protein [Armatimonadota bacterium]MDR7494056.1 sulfite exporter TauE/SafE family protein [Armatimonadota bacterium]MDR7504077.1 sulfite exporter TauE/SafE family protein [Armatimonadota bacterium]